MYALENFINGVAQGPITMLYDGDALIAEYDGSGALTQRYVHGSNPGADDPMVWYDGGAVGASARRHLMANWQGSPALIADSNGDVVNINAWDAYGIADSDNLGRFSYTGQIFLPEIGVYYYKARIYSPTLGRFLQTDPIGYEDQYNLYAYVANDPVNNTDPSGEVIETIWDVGNVVAGVASGVGNALEGNWEDAAIDAGGVLLDGAAVLVPGVPGGAAAGIKAVRNADKIEDGARAVGRAVTGRSKNKLKPDTDAQGPHSTFKRDSDGNVTNHAEWEPNPQNPTGHQEVKRVDVTGKPHTNPDGTVVPTPHVREAGQRGVRPARPDELPK